MLFEQQQINNYLKQAKLLQRHQVTQHCDWTHAGIRRGSPDMEGTGVHKKQAHKILACPNAMKDKQKYEPDFYIQPLIRFNAL